MKKLNHKHALYPCGKLARRGILFVLITAAVFITAGCRVNTPTVPPQNTATPTQGMLFTATYTATAVNTATLTPQAPSFTVTATVSMTADDTSTATWTLTASSTVPEINTDTATPSATQTSTDADTATYTSTPTVTCTATILPTNTNTVIPMTFGGAGEDFGYGSAACSGGAFAIAGSTASWGNGGQDVILVKYNSDGGVPWYRNFGGVMDDEAYAVKQDYFGFIIAGKTSSSGAGGSDGYIIKTDLNGDNPVYAVFGGTADDYFSAVHIDNASSFIAAGSTYSYDAGVQDMYAVKMTSALAFEWSVTLGGSGSSRAAGVCDRGDFYVAGTSNSLGTGGGDDIVLWKISWQGEPVYVKTYGAALDDQAASITVTADGGYIISGQTYSYGNASQIYLLKLDSNGDKQWDSVIGGSGDDWASSAYQLPGGGYIVFGSTASYGSGNTDMVMVRTDASGSELWHKTFGGSGYDYASSGVTGTDGSFFMTGSTQSYGMGMNDAYSVKTDSGGIQQW